MLPRPPQDSLLRLNADFQNFRNRTEREKVHPPFPLSWFIDAPPHTNHWGILLPTRRPELRPASQTEIASRVKGEVLEELIPLVDNFEAAKQFIKPETDGEKKIESSYQGLYKQMVDLFKKLGIDAASAPPPVAGCAADCAREFGVLRLFARPPTLRPPARCKPSGIRSIRPSTRLL